jgi:diguanylate cyclase (GGDEF)-like protein
VPVLYNDEIGSLTGSFNHLAEQLHSLVSDLDARVVTRTAELTAANEQLRQKLDEIQHLQEQLREQAIRDPLTNLFNRRYLQETLVREIAQAERRKWNIGIIMMDIDRFKQVNDSRGHHVGDQVLQEFGKLLVSGVRKGDIACRLGGEEFMVIIPSASLESTFQRANEICNAFEALSARIIQNPKVHVTISAGVVIYPTHGADYDTLLQNADSALYLAKHLGRNRVEVLPGR